MSQRAMNILVVSAIAVLAVVVLLPGIGGEFIFDDLANVARNPLFQPEEWGLREFLLATTGNDSPLGRPVTMATFALNAMISGLDPAAFKMTGIFLHAAAAVFVCVLTISLFRLASPAAGRHQASWFGLATGAAWAFHPLAVTSTLYVVQRMNLLSTLFVVLALLGYLAARRQTSLRRALTWLALAGFAFLLGMFSKETAALLPIYVLLLEYFLLPSAAENTLQWKLRTWLIRLSWLGVGLMVAGMLVGWSSLTSGYEQRDFSLPDRLLTQMRVFWHYVEMVLAPSHYSLGLFLDDIAISRGWLNPITTTISAISLGIYLSLIAFLRLRRPLLAFGLALFLAGHLLEGTVLPLEMAFEHRNYFPAIGLLLALADFCRLIYERSGSALICAALLSAFIGYLVFLTSIRAASWESPYVLAQLEAQHHPDSARAQAQLGTIYVDFARIANVRGDDSWEEFYFEAAAASFSEATTADPKNAFWHLNELLLASERGIDFDEQRFEKTLELLRSGSLSPALPQMTASLAKCVSSHLCSLTGDKYEQILQALYSNPRLSGRLRSEILVAIANFLGSQQGRLDLALAMRARAVAASPDIVRFRIFLIRQLIEMERWDDAALELKVAREKDAFGLHSAELDAFESRLENRVPPDESGKP